MIRSFALFLVWTVVGFIASFALLYGFTPAGPVIVLVVWLAYNYLPRISGERMPEAAGALGGFGLFWLFIATTVEADASPFILVGMTFGLTAVGWYVGAARRRCAGGVTAS